MRILSKKGDTIIEVLLAMALLTMILFTSWGLVNRSTQLSLAARKRIDMVNQLKEQAEILKSKYASAGGSLTTMEDDVKDDLPEGLPASPNARYDQADFCSQPDNPGGAANTGFYFNSSAKAKAGGNDVGGDGNSYVWIERKPGVGYEDFYVRGCWLTSGGQQKTDNAQFIVRLNT